MYTRDPSLGGGTPGGCYTMYPSLGGGTPGGTPVIQILKTGMYVKSLEHMKSKV